MSSALTRYGTRGRTVGRPPGDDRAVYYAQRFPVPLRYLRSWRLLDQLDACKCDAARRLILGVSRKEE